MSETYVAFAAHPATWAPLLAFATSLLVVRWLTSAKISSAILDVPKSRSLHDVPIPRTGGIGLHCGVLVAVGLVAPNLPRALWIALGGVILISLMDDVRSISPALRLVVHIAAGAMLAAAILGSAHIVLVIVVALACAWMANLYNFMDGADGLAGGMAVAGFSFYGAAAWMAGDREFALLNISIATAALGFLVFNFHPARIFLGDVGSVPLGFLAAALGTVGWSCHDWAWWFPVVVFAPFIVDASVTLMRRLLRMERIWEAHRDHYYQRLVRIGWGHRRTAVAEYCLMLASGITAIGALRLSDTAQFIVLALIITTYLVLVGATEIAWRRHQASEHL